MALRENNKTKAPQQKGCPPLGPPFAPPPPWGGRGGGGIPLGYPIIPSTRAGCQAFSQKKIAFFPTIFLDYRLGCQAKSPGRCRKISEKISAKRLTVRVFQAKVSSW